MILIISDIHFRDKQLSSRADSPRDTIKAKFLDLVSKTHNLTDVIFLGDLLHDRNPNVSSIYSFLKLLDEVFPEHVNLYSVVGNHDLLLAENESILDLDIRIKKFDVLTIENTTFVATHYYNEFQKATNKNQVLLSHKMIVPQVGTVPTEEEIPIDRIATLGYPIVFTGHYHNSFDIKLENCHIINPGVVYRNANEKNIVSFGILLNPKTLEFEKIPILRFDTFKQVEQTSVTEKVTDLLTKVGRYEPTMNIEVKLLQAPLSIRKHIEEALAQIKK